MIITDQNNSFIKIFKYQNEILDHIEVTLEIDENNFNFSFIPEHPVERIVFNSYIDINLV